MTYALLIIIVQKTLSPYQALERIFGQMSPLHPRSRAASGAAMLAQCWAVLLYLSLHRVVSQGSALC